jgi:lipopolysaccharide transport system permease protein
MTEESAQPVQPGKSDAAGRRRAPAGDRRGESGAERRWIENRPSRSWLPRLDLAELWASRELTLALALRNVKTRYKQTVLGVLWTILQPLAAVAIFSLLFGRLAGIPSDEIPYPVFVYSGLAVWLYFSSASSLASESLAQHRELVTKVYFPRLHAPFASVLPGLVDLTISLIALGVFMAIYGVAPTAAIVLLPIWVLAAVLFTFAVGVWLSALNVRYRDVRNALAFLLQLWFFATPIVYASSLLGEGWTVLLALNPMAGLVEGFRWSLIGAPAPGAWALVSLAVGVLVLLGGVTYFGRVQRRFADLI